MEVCTGWNTVAAQKRKWLDSTSREDALNQGVIYPDRRLRNSWIGCKQGFVIVSGCSGPINRRKRAETGLQSFLWPYPIRT